MRPLRILGLVLASAFLFVALSRFLPRTRSPIASRVAASAPASSPARPAPPPAAGTPGARFAAAVTPARARTEALARAEAFNDWLLAWRRADAAQQSGLVASGRALAQMRRDALAYLIQTDPQRALALAVHPGVRRELPAELRPWLEEQIDTRGRLDVAIRCFDAPGQSAEPERIASADGRRWHAHVFGRRNGQSSREDIPLHGIALGAELALSDLPYRVIESAEEGYAPADGEFAVRVGSEIRRLSHPGALASLQEGLLAAESGLGPVAPPEAAAVPVGWNSGAKRVLFIRVEFSDVLGGLMTDGEINAAAAASGAFYEENSQADSSFSATIFPSVLRLAQTQQYYADTPFAMDDMATDIVRRAHDYDVANGGTGLYDPDRADRWVIIHPKFPGTGYAGVGRIGQRGIWMNGAFDVSTLAHELGHNAGVYHSNSWSVPPAVAPYASTGTHNEYGDIFDVMGDSRVLANAAFNVAQKQALGFLPAAAISTIAADGTYRLYRHDHRNASGVRGLKIPSVVYDYYLEYRLNPSARQTAAQVTAQANTVQLRWGGTLPYFGSNFGTYLLDSHPEGMGDYLADSGDSGVAIGTSYTDNEAGVTITPLATGGVAPNQYIDVKVEFGGRNGNRNPVLAFVPAATTFGARTNYNFSATASDPDGDTVQYRWDFGDRRTNPQTATQTHRWLKGGNYTVSAIALDGKSGRSVASYPVTVTDPFLGWDQRGREIVTSQTYLAGLYAGGRFVFGGSNGLLAVSADGVNWTSVTSPVPTLTVRGLAYNGTRYVAVGLGSSPTGLRSDDGTVWQAVSMPAGANDLQAVAASSSRFVAVGANGKIFVSTDGATWTENPSPVTDQLYDVKYDANLFVAVGINGRVITSPDGLTWTNRTLPIPHYLHTVARAGNLWYATPGTYVWTSPDAITWTQSSESPNTNIFRLIATPDGTLVGPTSVGEIAWTEGSLAWEKVTIDPARPTEYHGPIAAGNGLVVIAGGEGRIYTAGTPTVAAPLLRDLRALPEVQAGRANPVGVAGSTFTLLELLVDGQKVAENNGTSALSWTPSRFGSYQVAARGTLSGGGTVTSAAETVRAVYSDWSWSSPLPFVASLQGGVRANDRWYLVGGSGGIFSVDDSGNATRVTLPSNERFSDIDYANGRFVASSSGYDYAHNVASYGLWSSTDGITWAPWRDGLGVTINGLAYGPGLWVCVGSGRSYTSTNGVDWTASSLITSNSALTDVNYGGGQWVASSTNGTMYTSPDALTWTSHTTSSTNYLAAVAYYNGHWVAVGNNTEILHSPDGITWTHINSGITGNDQFAGIARGRDGFVAVTVNGLVRVSTDGVTWSAGTKPSGTPSFAGVATDGTNTLLLGAYGSYLASTSATNTWARPTNFSTAGEARQVIYANNRFVAVGGNTDVETGAAANSIRVSTDGTIWTAATLNTGTPNLRGVAWSGAMFIAAGDSSALYTSTDGTSWTKRTAAGTSQAFRGVASGGTSHVVVGINTIQSSADGITWTSRTSPVASPFLNAVVYGPSGYIAVGEQGTILASTDGVTWTARTSGSTSSLSVVSYVQGMGYVVGGFGACLASTDGVTWSPRNVGLSQSDIIYSITDTPQGAMITGGSLGQILFSGDGTNWVRGALPSDRAINSFAVGPTAVVGVGDRGLFLLQPRAQTVVATTPSIQSATAGGIATFSAGSVANGNATYQWQRNGSSISGAVSPNLTLGNIQPASTGVYTAVATNASASSTTAPAILGLTTANKVIGTGSEVAANVVHPNGNVFDQILLDGAAATFTADNTLNQITRLSFVDLSNDIVQVEFSGAGSVSIVLDAPTGPATAVNYNQPTVSYMKGHAGIVVAGANETTNLSVFSVGRGNAVNQALFKDNVTYDGLADIAFIAITSTNGKFGGLRTSNASYFATRGVTGVYAPGVEFTGPVFVGDINAQDSATPYLVIGSGSDVRVTGGDMLQANNRAVVVAGIAQLKFTAGTTSHFVDQASTPTQFLAAKNNRGRYEQNGVDVTSQIVVNPTP